MVVLDLKSLQEYQVNPDISQSTIFGPTLFLLFINYLPNNATCNIAFYADDTTFYSRCDWASHLWQQLESDVELESKLQDTGLGQEVASCF